MHSSRHQPHPLHLPLLCHPRYLPLLRPGIGKAWVWVHRQSQLDSYPLNQQAFPSSRMDQEVRMRLFPVTRPYCNPLSQQPPDSTVLCLFVPAPLVHSLLSRPNLNNNPSKLNRSSNNHLSCLRSLQVLQGHHSHLSFNHNLQASHRHRHCLPRIRASFHSRRRHLVQVH